MNVAVLGAGGTIAPAIVRDLASSEEVERLLLLDRDEARLTHVVSHHARATRGDGSKASLEIGVVDALHGLAEALEDVDVLINSASYRVNLDAMAACLRAGCHYLDLGGLYWMTELQLELAQQFEREGLLGLLGIGSAPGKTNLMAKLAVRELQRGSDGAGVDSIEVSAAGRDLDPPAGFSVPYALRTLLDELTMRPVILRDGRPQEIEPLSDGGSVDFGTPIGAQDTIHTLHSELRTFGESFGCRQASFRLSLSPALVGRLRQLVDAPEDVVERQERSAARPSARTVSVHVVDATAGERSARVRAVTEPIAEWGLGGGIVSTAAPAAAAVRLLARGAIETRGVLPPEGCIEPEDMFAELERRGCRFDVTTVEEVTA